MLSLYVLTGRECIVESLCVDRVSAVLSLYVLTGRECSVESLCVDRERVQC